MKDHKDQVASHYNAKKKDFNFVIAQGGGVVHHHEGLLTEDEASKLVNLRDEITLKKTIYQLESNLVGFLADFIHPSPSVTSIGFDAGCRRGGSSILLNQRYGCDMKGVTLSKYQADFANKAAHSQKRGSQLVFRREDMTETSFDNNTFDFIWACGSTEHIVDLRKMFKEFYRVAKPGAPLIVYTWTRNDERKDVEEFASQVDDWYKCKLHNAGQYKQMAQESGWSLEKDMDCTEDGARYWELRTRLKKGSGSEKFMYPGFRGHALNYWLFVFRKI